LLDYVPLYRPTKTSDQASPVAAVTQFGMEVLESLGLLKVDFLGLSTLTVMARACALIESRHGVSLDIDSIPLDDPATYGLLGRGEVLGVFQVEGSGMRRYLMEMKPTRLANITAMVALFRPGPMEFIPDYIRRMHGEEQARYRHERLAPILEETYGITVYQEQIMYTAMQLAGYSAGDADLLRKAVAKKKAEALHKERDKFVRGAAAQGIPDTDAHAIFDDWEAFARYGFNKGHAADYAVLCVETAYLKTHYPLEYMTALLSVFKGDTERVALYIGDCRRMGIEVRVPDLNASGLDFEVELGEGRGAIRYGLSAVKNVGEGAVRAMLEARNDGGSFADLGDLARRVDLRVVGKRALESLIRVGACDRFGGRQALLQSLDRIVAASTAHFRAAEIGQMSLFGGASSGDDGLSIAAEPAGGSPRQYLQWEKELLGIYVSEHPLTRHLADLSQVVTHSSSELGEAPSGQEVVVAGEVTAVRPYQTRSGKPMGFVTLEDLQGTIELVVFTRLWHDIAGWIEPRKIVVVKGKVDAERGDPKVLADSMSTEFSLVRPRGAGSVSAVPVAAPADELEGSPPAPSLEAELELEPEPPPEAVPLSAIIDVLAAAPLSVTAEVKPLVEPALERALERPPLPAAFGDLALVDPGFRGPGDADPRLLTIRLASTGDTQRDARRMRRVHGLLLSYPGVDRFVFHVFEASRQYHLEFPNSTTGFCKDLFAQLTILLGEGMVAVERLRLQ
jgi:DNA polymerase-3 subunit alpha